MTRWSADEAARELVLGEDRDATYDEAVAHAREALLRAYDAGKAEAHAGLAQDVDEDSKRIRAEIAERRAEIRRGARPALPRFEL